MGGSSWTGVGTLDGGLDLIKNPFKFAFNFDFDSSLLLEGEDIVEGKEQADYVETR